jgi:hypothetical protein
VRLNKGYPSQLELMANPSADLMSKFVEVIFEVLLGPKQIQLKPSITSSPNSSSGYSILQLETAFVLWLINGEEEIVRSETDETANTPFLGLKGSGHFGLKTNQNPDASVRFKEWGKLTFSVFLRGEHDRQIKADTASGSRSMIPVGVLKVWRTILVKFNRR